MVRVSHHGDEESSWAPEAEIAPTEQQEVHDGTSIKVGNEDSSDSKWIPQWPNPSNAAPQLTGTPNLHTPYDLMATPQRRRDLYATAVAQAVTPDDLFSVSSSSTNQTARRSNKSHSPSNSAYDSPLDVRRGNDAGDDDDDDDAADDTSSAYFARSPFTIAPITPSSTVMSYSSSDVEGSSHRQQHSHNRDSSFVTETTMEYDSSTVGTSSAVAVLYQPDASSSSVADDTCTTNGSAVVTTDAAVQSLGGIEAAMGTPPGDHFIRKGDPGTEWNTPNILSNEDSTLGGGEISVGGVLKLLEEGDGDEYDEGNLVPYRKQPNGKEGFCTTIRRKKMLLLGLLALSMVCLVIGLYVAMPRNKKSIPSETRAGSIKDDEDNIFSSIGGEVNSPPTQPASAEPVEMDVLTSISVISSPLDEDDDQSSLESREEGQRSPSPTSLPTEQPSLSATMEVPSPAPTVINYCGNGKNGNGVCLDSNLCCSAYGWCGKGEAYCRI